MERGPGGAVLCSDKEMLVSQSEVNEELWVRGTTNPNIINGRQAKARGFCYIPMSSLYRTEAAERDPIDKEKTLKLYLLPELQLQNLIRDITKFSQGLSQGDKVLLGLSYKFLVMNYLISYAFLLIFC